MMSVSRRRRTKMVQVALLATFSVNILQGLRGYHRNQVTKPPDHSCVPPHCHNIVNWENQKLLVLTPPLGISITCTTHPWCVEKETTAQHCGPRLLCNCATVSAPLNNPITRRYIILQSAELERLQLHTLI